MYSILLVTHVIAGFISLAFLFIPVVVKKGGRIHIFTGWIFTVSMFVISGTSVGMVLITLTTSNVPVSEYSFSIFLFFIAVLSYVTAMHGLRVLRFKAHKGKHNAWFDWMNSSFLTLSALIVIVFGITLNDALLTWFPFIGVFLGMSQLLYWATKPKYKTNWIVEHLTGMLSCGVSAITAFISLVHLDSLRLVKSLFSYGSAQQLLLYQLSLCSLCDTEERKPAFPCNDYGIMWPRINVYDW
ncbi:hypothetical protein [Geomicrobium sp. JCM 19039]|uniref:hypothetical protein n=1 Tax=Geomicrobium sp. JCM 19039 TaxID=1460636 RepID=UPI00045F27FC|nr:hypothetical protein [Geomicrobium sp. JCM 19039]GAK12715.1 hypothetical protein JCM19039_2510 [Geomicrobium sp. JCM 19039]